MNEQNDVTTDEAVAVYLSGRGIFHGLLSEMRELCKKKADATLSKSKVSILNRIMVDLRGILQSQPEGKYLDLLDDEDLPQNSDAVLVMVQYETALHAFYRRYHFSVGGHEIWRTEKQLEEWKEEEDLF